jgi:hypothetical protein
MNEPSDMAGERDEPARATDEARTAIAPSPAQRDRLLASLSGSERFTLFAGDVARTFGVTVDDARAALRLVQDPRAWHPGSVPGVSWLTTPALAKLDVVIARLAVDMRIPKHPHSSREITLVLDGLLIEDGDRTLRAGDVLDMAIGTEHEIAVAGEHACLAVFFPARM